MTRFHLVLIATVMVGGTLLVCGHTAPAVAVLGAFLVSVGLGVVFPRLSLFGSFICRGNTLLHQVALTFDDGPDARSTPALLDLLRKERVQAAFFCVGSRVRGERELAARIVNEGHLLENHSFAHSNLTNFFGTSRLLAELDQTQAAIREAAGVTPTFFRPPMGLSNPLVFAAARQRDLRVVGWSARGLDTVTEDPDRVVRRILRRTGPGGILLLHDGGIPSERLLLTVRGLLTSLRQGGYEIVRLDKLLQ